MVEIQKNAGGYKNKISSSKIEISFIIFLFGINENNNQLFEKIISNYKEIQEILNLKEKDIFKFIYFNKTKVHQILYDEDEIINVDFEIEKNLSFYFYFHFLIREDKWQINYQFSIDFINQLNSLQENNNDKKYQKMIISKIVIELIKNYKETYNYKEEKEVEILNKIENDNKKIIEENINYFSEIGLNITKEDILLKNVDEIYIDIIYILMKERKFEDYEYSNKILKELDLENIDITKYMLDNLNKFLNSNESYIIDYMINCVEDLVNEKKINFYYLLFKYLFKNSIYIYNIPLLLETRRNILNILKSNTNHLSICIYPNIKDKLEFIIKKLCDSKYYNNNINSLIELNYYSLNQEERNDTNEQYNTYEEQSSIFNTSDFPINFYDKLQTYLKQSIYIIKINKKENFENNNGSKMKK